jgi:hypothetical protein
MKRIILVAVLFAAMTTVAFTQAVEGFAASPQSIATQGRYRSTADNFIRPDSFSGVSFEKFFFMTSFASTTEARLGFATKLGSAYLGLGYSGTFWTNVATPLTYREEYSAWPAGAKTIPVYG